jgi:hypothetical protein
VQAILAESLSAKIRTNERKLYKRMGENLFSHAMNEIIPHSKHKKHQKRNNIVFFKERLGYIDKNN